MTRFYIALFTIFFIYYHQVACNISQFPINIDEMKNYIDNIMSVIQENSCLLSNKNDFIRETNLLITIDQIKKAILQLGFMTFIVTNIVNGDNNEKHGEFRRIFFHTDRYYKNFQIDISNISQLSHDDYDSYGKIIRARIDIRKLELEYLRDRFIRDRNQPEISILTDAISIYESRDRVLWCNKNNYSWHLSLFHLYYDIIINELRIYLMDFADYILLSCYFSGIAYDSANKNEQLSIVQDVTGLNFDLKKEDLLTNIRQYLHALKWAMAVSRKSIYQCAPRNLTKGETYIELSNSCIAGGPTLEICNANISSIDTTKSPSVYGLINDEHQVDHNSDNSNTCSNKIFIKIKFDKSIVSQLPQYTSEMCVRTCPTNDPTSDALRTISLMEQTSDIENNMVVTNIRFVDDNDMIQIQIEQGRLNKFNRYMIQDNRTWKLLSEFKKIYNEDIKNIEFYIDDNTREEIKYLTEGLDYAHINPNQKTLHLDDVILPVGYVVTGVRFGYADDSLLGHWKPFEIQIQATLYNVDTNELITVRDGKTTSFWVTPKMMNSLLPGYNRARIKYEGNVVGEDSSLDINWQLPDSKPNQYVDFSRSDILIRGEQRTVPFFDARPTFSVPPLPLGGIGLIIKGSRNAEAYITPTTFPYPITQIINL